MKLLLPSHNRKQNNSNDDFFLFYRIAFLSVLSALFSFSAFSQVTPSTVVPHIKTNGGGVMVVVKGGGGSGGGGCSAKSPDLDVELACGTTIGTVTVTSPLGSDYKYSNNGGTYQTDTHFNVPAGAAFSIVAYSINNNCSSSPTTGTMMDVLTPLIYNVTQPTCSNPTGTITVTAPVGTDFEYSNNGGTSYQNETTFTVSAGTNYSISVRKLSTGCISPATTGTMAAAVPPSLWYADSDGDGFGNPNVSQSSCSQPAGYVSNANDCDDNNASINPNTIWVLDSDGDGYYTGAPVTQCTSPGTGYVIQSNQQPGDCDDNNIEINPATVWYKDNDNDGYTDGTTVVSCYRPTGTDPLHPVTFKLRSQLKNPTDPIQLDCDDNNKTIYPGAPGSLCFHCQPGSIVYVKKDASGTNDGTSWTNAFTSLQTALYQQCPNVQQIWVAKGIYYPDEGGVNTNNDRSAAFMMKKDVGIYGGFSGNETALSQRDWKTNETILSGDIDQNDGPGFTNNSGNSYHVVLNYQTGLTNTAILDGFTITGGNANYTGNDPSLIFSQNGGGIMNVSSSPEINNCKFLANTTINNGGGIYNEQASPQFTKCTFAGNNANEDGGAVYNDGSTVSFYNCNFSSNTAVAGGGMYNNNALVNIINSSFVLNVGDGIDNASGSRLAVTNTIFSRNSGIPIINFGFTGSSIRSAATVTNCSFSQNEGLVTNTLDNMYIYNTISDKPIDNNPGTNGIPSDFIMEYSDIPSAPGHNNNFYLNPQYVDPANDNLRLQSTSPAINEGYDAFNSEPLDLDGNQRKVGFIDMGAYESPIDISLPTITVITSSGSSCDGNTVTFVATVTNRGNAVTNGTVTFSEGAVIAQGRPLDANGQATIQTHSLSANSHTIVATYNNVAGYSSSNGSVNTTIFANTAITTNVSPTYITALNGGSPVLSIVAAGDGLTYQWYKFTPGAPTPVKITDGTGAQTGTFTPDITDNTLYYYYVTVTGTCGQVNSSNTVILVNNQIVADGNGIVYVTQNGSGNKSGNSWANATNNLQDAINGSHVKEVWVASGNYHPDMGGGNGLGSRNATFIMKNSLAIYGGFAGTETSLSQRNLASNTSVLSGDIGTAGDNADNSYSVVTSPGTNSSSILDGFTVTGGNANGGDVFSEKGGGLHDGQSAAPTIVNCKFNANYAQFGGAIYNDNHAGPIFTNCLFTNNTAVNDGGAIFNEASATARIINSTFYGNAGSAAITSSSDAAIIEDCILWGNPAAIGGNATVSHSIVQGGYSGTANLSTDPTFVDAAGGNFHLLQGSPGINAGNNLDNTETIDLDGNPRKVSVIDMGPYEYQGALPVTLISFAAQAEGAQAKLNWTTATEVNNKEFIISRSGDGIHFIDIGTVVGAGNSDHENDYVFYDKNPLNGHNFYRLEQVDIDGQQKVDGIRLVDFSLLSKINIYPNPANQILHVEFTSGIYQKAELLDLDGRSIKVFRLGVLDTGKTIDITNLSSGTYFLWFTGNDKVDTRKVVKQ